MYDTVLLSKVDWYDSHGDSAAENICIKLRDIYVSDLKLAAGGFIWHVAK